MAVFRIMHDLEYESVPKLATRVSCRTVAVIAGTVVAGATHFVICGIVSSELFRLAGGVSESGVWTRSGGIDYAWTNLAWAAGGLLLACGETTARGTPVLGLPALCVLLAGSIFAGHLLLTAVVAAVRHAPDRGRFGWRVWAFAPFWLAWFPVPVKMTVTYWHTVAY